jgi:hypothetical protein
VAGTCQVVVKWYSFDAIAPSIGKPAAGCPT